MSVRVLVVDDFEPWRRFVSSCLNTSGHYEIVGELADGLGAAEAVEHLKPDVILLDIGLPSRSGIEVAREILGVAPASRILFLSEHRSVEIADAALATGAYGYVVKSDAGRALLPAIDAILQGRRFVSAAVKPGFEQAPAVPVTQAARRHELQLCSNETLLWGKLAGTLERALEEECAVILVAAAPNRDAVQRTLESRGLDMKSAAADGRYVSLDVSETLATFMTDDAPDEARFWESVTDLIETARKASTCEPPRVVACGECAPVLWRNGQAAAAVRLEQLWDVLAQSRNVEVVCGYALQPPVGDEESRIFQQIRAAHSAVHTHEGN